MSNIWLYEFDSADKSNKSLLGGKGANLAAMTQLGLPVPPGFTITTEACNAYTELGAWPAGLADQLREAVGRLEQRLGKGFGDESNPLLFSVRSGAKFSMPGMMDTILNLGLNDATCEALAKKTGNPRFAKDSYRRLIQTFGDVAMGIELELFENEELKKYLTAEELPAALAEEAESKDAATGATAASAAEGPAAEDEDEEGDR